MSKTGKYWHMIIFGYVLWGVAQGLLSTVVDSTSYGRLIGFQILAGFGAAFTFQTFVLPLRALRISADHAYVHTEHWLRSKQPYHATKWELQQPSEHSFASSAQQ